MIEKAKERARTLRWLGKPDTAAQVDRAMLGDTADLLDELVEEPVNLLHQEEGGGGR